MDEVYLKLLGDETGIHYVKSKREIDNKVCLTKKAKRPVIAKRFQRTKKVFS